jgi:hypothetical protein
VAVAGQLGFVGAQAHRAAHIGIGAALLEAFCAHPFGDDAHHRLAGVAEFGGRRPRNSGGVARAFDARYLHAQADPEERHIALTRETHRFDLAFGPAHPESAGHQDAVHRL